MTAETGRPTASAFSPGELAFLAEDNLGRLATVDESGAPHVVPVGWNHNPTLDTIDIGGRDFAATKKFRNVRRDGRAAIVVDDVLPPFRPRGVQIRGRAEALDAAQWPDGTERGPIVRITPDRVVSWGLDSTED